MGKNDDRWDAHWISTKIEQRTLQEAMRDHIVKVLKQSDGNVSLAARVLGIHRASLYNYAHKFKLGITSGSKYTREPKYRRDK